MHSAVASGRLVGVDEAGRGSFLGPLVVGAFAVAPDRLAELLPLGVRDSKLLSPEARERVYLRLGAVGELRSVFLPPRAIDRAVLKAGLNELEAEAFGRLVKDLGAAEARVDACDTDEARFARRVARIAGPGVRIIARHHADRDDPLVGAASIIAKVRRDRAIARLRRSLGVEVGSGYPSDETTVAFVRGFVREHGTPEWLRTSWATMKRVKPAVSAASLDRYLP